MRITGGTACGRVIPSPNGRAVRPTASKIRQALFNIIGTRVEGARFVDVFAGSGLMGMEALSRGADSLVAVEQDRKIARAIENSLLQLGFQAEVICDDVHRVVARMGKNSEKFDLIFADPPYASDSVGKIVCDVDKYEVLDLQGLLIVEHAKGYRFAAELHHLEIKDSRNYGQSTITFFGFQ